jgi:hypothetical protein
MTLGIETRRARDVAVPPGPSGSRATDLISAFDLPADRRTLYVLRSRNYGEIWQLEPGSLR